MKKITIVSILSILFLAGCSITEYLLRNHYFEKFITPLIIGFALLIFSGIIILFSKRDILFNIICYIINSIALGFCLRSWYMFREFDNDLWITLLVSLSCVVYLLIFYFLLYIPFFNKHFMFYIWTFFILTLIAYIIVVATSKTTFVSTFGYFVIVEISFIFAMCRTHENFEDIFYNVTISSYSVLIVAIIMLLIMLECDSFDGFDFGGDGSSITSPKEDKKQKYKL